VARHRLGEEEAAFHVLAELEDDGAERLVRGLLLENDEGADEFRPASIIVANWREKICSDFALTFLPPIDVDPIPPPSEISLIVWASRPLTRSCSRAAFRSAALISPESSAPWALIAE